MDEAKGEKELRIKSYAIREDTAKLVAVSFKDTGIGIAEENFHKLFEPFFSTKPVGKGTGLGLSLCYGIIAAHGGRIEIKSERGKGTEVTVMIPVKREKKE